MKKIVTTYSLLASAISAVMWIIISLGMKEGQGFENGMFIGYAAMTLSFLMIYFAQASYRTNIGNGYISFGKAIQIGLLITLISGIFYVIVWAIVYNTMLPDFMEQYSAYELNKLQESGASEAKIKEYVKSAAIWKERYKNPLWFSLMTFMEPLPVGIIVTLISTFLARMKNKPKSIATA